VDKITACLTHDKTTKNKERYSLLDGEDNPGIASVYLEKAALGPSPPRQVNVVIEAATTYGVKGD
jgi:hypothetical protein